MQRYIIKVTSNNLPVALYVYQILKIFRLSPISAIWKIFHDIELLYGRYYAIISLWLAVRTIEFIIRLIVIVLYYLIAGISLYLEIF